MSGAHHDVLNRALAVRLSMQISLSALPIVEEWMDIHLTRWLESVPLPPEMPSGHLAHFTVGLRSDLSRLEWRAYGNPAGFVPKLVQYYETIKVPREELQLLDDIGTALEPALVGTWIAVDGGQVVNGWHFCDEHPWSGLTPFLADSPATRALSAWVEDAGVETFTRFSQLLADTPYSDIELPLPGMSPDDKLAAAGRAFTALAGGELPQHAIAAMVEAGSTDFSLQVRIRAGELARVAVLSPGLKADTISTLCSEAEVACAAEYVQVTAALGAEGPDRVVYSRGVPGGDAGVELLVIPSENPRPNPLRMN